ncbi:hypothetical protein M0805_000149 [Coniferiporia weirii]|nr:hypothetical protein M0805_000149 [Coniferiporia weirii]
MFSALRLHLGRRQPVCLANARRWLATEISIPAADDGKDSEEQQRIRYEEFLEQKALEPPERPQLNVAVKDSHGLYAFFRQVPTEGGLTTNSATIYETIEPKNKPSSRTGRSWNAVELRRKSFKDLHTLWYIVLRERNLLATQRAEAKRLGVLDEYVEIREKDTRCRKTMARIKQVLNERRIAYEQAYAMDYERYKTISEKEKAEQLALQKQKAADDIAREQQEITKKAGRNTQTEARRKRQADWRPVSVESFTPSREAETRGRLAFRRLARERGRSAAL